MELQLCLGAPFFGPVVYLCVDNFFDSTIWVGEKKETSILTYCGAEPRYFRNVLIRDRKRGLIHGVTMAGHPCAPGVLVKNSRGEFTSLHGRDDRLGKAGIYGLGGSKDTIHTVSKLPEKREWSKTRPFDAGVTMGEDVKFYPPNELNERDWRMKGHRI